ncbi:N-acyl-D-amino-acid deacylase [Nakamurella panacisegetis]|uniref:N-acyl-D-amino-acid deacylase n=1 Tax=Nakamurella panacisegetis TaxID=1090615 RepID=A0A1H0HKW3_9ACTN|nr:N-acyl-D-amino-acid deacylase [Nakamurella panacisegetis]
MILRGGIVVDGADTGERRADVAVAGQRVTAVGAVDPEPGDLVVDCTDRLVLPGLIDAHSHADAAVFDPAVADALLRQGVTTVIAGQDGVSFAPGDGRYATAYFGALNGAHPTYRGSTVADLLDGWSGGSPVNVGYLVPHGTVRQLVMGDADRPPTPPELAEMARHVAHGLAEGALGLSTGLDYAPGCFADTAELVELARPVARAGALYVTHMRGGYEANLASGIDEVCEIARAADVPVHVSHLHGPVHLISSRVDAALDDGIDLTFDAYPYRRGCSLLAMPMLPPDLLRLGARRAAEQLRDPAVRCRVTREWLPLMALRPDLGPAWAQNITLAGIGTAEFAWAEGLTLAQAAARVDSDPGDFGLTLIAASDLAVSAVLKVPHQRPVAEFGEIFAHRAHLGSSDGIYLGGHPHPRGWGTFARYLGRHVRERRDMTWSQAAAHLAGRTAARHGLGDRGRIVVGAAADLVVVDPATVVDRADYDHPRRTAVGIDDVLVNGTPVLRGGLSTGERPGEGLRRNAPAAPGSWPA